MEPKRILFSTATWVMIVMAAVSATYYVVWKLATVETKIEYINGIEHDFLEYEKR